MIMNEQEETSEDQSSPDTESMPDESLRELVESTNIAEKLEKEELEEIGKQCKEGFERDLQSRADWEDQLANWTSLALQVKETKTWPWTNASNVKYPLVSIASMQFNARAYPSLVPSTTDLVKCEVIGKDPDGQKLEKGKRIGGYMTYQILNKMEGWEEDMDKLLIMLPIVGTMFKKTYYDSVVKENCSELILPKNLVVDYWAKSLETAERVSEMLEFPKRVLKEKQMSGVYLKDVELGDPVPNTDDKTTAQVQDETTPYSIIEQHRYWDMDDDGYAEPYIVTFERYSGKVLRIVARYDDNSVVMKVNSKGKNELAKINPIQYYTKFSFIPNPEGGFYDIGFGLLLSPLNESANTLINQIIDAGTIANLQAGFLGKGIKLRMGENRFQPGEWKTVQSTSDDLRKQIIPLPTKEPSKVLFELLGMIVTGAKELASVAEIFVGKMPGQNTPATTTMATIEQGMKVFTAVYKRVYRSLKSEFKKLFALNAVYLDLSEYEQILDEPVDKADFDQKTYDVCPGADPNTATTSEKLMKAQALMEMLQLGTLDVVEVTKRMLDAQEQPSPERLLSQEIQKTGQHTPPPDPKIQALELKKQADQQKGQMDMMQAQHKMELESRGQQFELMMKAQEHRMDMRHEAMMSQLKTRSMMEQNQAKIVSGAAQTHQQLQQTEATHQQGMRHQEEAGKLKIQQAKQQPKNSTNSGKKTK